MRSVTVIALSALLWVGVAGAQNAGYKIFGGTDFPGNDLYQSGAGSTQACAAQCIADARCGAFTFNIPLRTCYLKAGPSQFEGTFSAESGIVDGRQNRPPPPPPAGQAQAPQGAASLPSCSVGGTPKCPGCSVTCAPGENPVCTHAIEGVTSVCARNATCSCSPR